MSKVVTLNINDKPYTVSTDENELQLKEAAILVDSTIREISSKTQLKNEGKVAIMAAIQIAFDLVKQRESEQKTMHKLEEMVSVLDKELSL